MVGVDRAEGASDMPNDGMPIHSSKPSKSSQLSSQFAPESWPPAWDGVNPMPKGAAVWWVCAQRTPLATSWASDRLTRQGCAIHLLTAAPWPD